MKRCFIILLSLLLTSCGGSGQASDREPSSSRSHSELVSGGGSLPDERSQADLSEELLAIAVDFAESFDDPFSSPEELNAERFCLLKIYYEDPEAITEDGGLYWINQERLEEEVRRRFDLPDYRFQSPEAENVYPRYVEERGAVVFSLAGGGNWLTAVPVGQTADGEYYDYTFELYDDVITDEHPERTLEKTLRYRFRVTETSDGKPFLQGVSATELSAEIPGPIEEDAVSYTVEASPFFHLDFDNVRKIYNYDAAIGEEWTVVDPQVIEKIMEKVKNITFYDEPAPDDPWTGSFRYQCFDYFAFYENEEDEIPIFSMGLEPFYVKIGEEKFGPYAVGLPDGYVTELLKLFLPAR